LNGSVYKYKEDF